MEQGTEGRPPGRPSTLGGAAAPTEEPAGIPRLAEGVELLGRYEGSGFKEPPYIAKRGDGQMVQLPPLLYAVAEEIDGGSDVAAIAARVSARIRREIEPQDLAFLIEEKLAPLGVVAARSGEAEPVAAAADPMLALKLRTKVVPKRAVRAIATIFQPLFFPLVIVAVLAGLVVLDWWLFFDHGVAQSLRAAIYQPLLLLLVLGMVVISAAFHESGHAAGAKYGGADPGEMGVGIYIVWPAFYTNVTDTYRLGKGGRLRTDLGGVYFNAIFILLTSGVYFLTRFEPLLLVIVVQHLEIVRQLLPVVRLDGYYILSDLTGVPDMFSRIKPVLVSLLPWRETDPRVAELKVWPRVVVTFWVTLVVPLLAFQLALIVVHAPRIVATALDSLARLGGTVSSAFGDGRPGAAVVGILQMLLLVLPLAGVAYT
ncbi:MAG TPA: hypothetical protein VM638_01395, partial [Actinomycetota bacterium]|nr:hypothetical protein [Actinomycetota bacterium]